MKSTLPFNDKYADVPWTGFKIRDLNLPTSQWTPGFSVSLIFWASNYAQYDFSFKYIVILHNIILKYKLNTSYAVHLKQQVLSLLRMDDSFAALDVFKEKFQHTYKHNTHLTNHGYQM